MVHMLKIDYTNLLTIITQNDNLVMYLMFMVILVIRLWGV